jgi:hypothetical protein
MFSAGCTRRTGRVRCWNKEPTLVQAVAAGKAEEAGSIAVSNVYRYYPGDLDAAEKCFSRFCRHAA